MKDNYYVFRSLSRTGIQRLRRIRAPSFELAKEICIAKFKHIIYHKDKTMDLITAIERAKKASLDTKKTYYVILEPDGECSVNTAPLSGASHKYTNGEEDKSFHAKPTKEQLGEATPPKPEKVKADKLKKSKVKTEAPKESAKENKKEMKRTSPVKKAMVKKATPAKKEAPVKKVVAKKKGTVSNLKTKINGGAVLDILNALKKKPSTKAELAKAGKTKESNISWYLSKIKNNGYKIELVENKYKLKK